MLRSPTAFRIEIVRRDGTTLSPRFAFRSIAAHGARELRRDPSVISATVIEA